LASANRNGDVPTLGRECATEAEAIIEAFREKVNLYKVTEFQTRSDIRRSGELDRESLRRRAAHAGPIAGSTLLYRVEFHLADPRTP